MSSALFVTITLNNRVSGDPFTLSEIKVLLEKRNCLYRLHEMNCKISPLGRGALQQMPLKILKHKFGTEVKQFQFFFKRNHYNSRDLPLSRVLDKRQRGANVSIVRYKMQIIFYQKMIIKLCYCQRTKNAAPEL